MSGLETKTTTKMSSLKTKTTMIPNHFYFIQNKKTKDAFIAKFINLFGLYYKFIKLDRLGLDSYMQIFQEKTFYNLFEVSDYKNPSNSNFYTEPPLIIGKFYAILNFHDDTKKEIIAKLMSTNNQNYTFSILSEDDNYAHFLTLEDFENNYSYIETEEPRNSYYYPKTEEEIKQKYKQEVEDNEKILNNILNEYLKKQKDISTIYDRIVSQTEFLKECILELISESNLSKQIKTAYTNTWNTFFLKLKDYKSLFYFWISIDILILVRYYSSPNLRLVYIQYFIANIQNALTLDDITLISSTYVDENIFLSLNEMCIKNSENEKKDQLEICTQILQFFRTHLFYLKIQLHFYFYTFQNYFTKIYRSEEDKPEDYKHFYNLTSEKDQQNFFSDYIKKNYQPFFINDQELDPKIINMWIEENNVDLFLKKVINTRIQREFQNDYKTKIKEFIGTLNQTEKNADLYKQFNKYISTKYPDYFFYLMELIDENKININTSKQYFDEILKEEEENQKEHATQKNMNITKSSGNNNDEIKQPTRPDENKNENEKNERKQRKIDTFNKQIYRHIYNFFLTLVGIRYNTLTSITTEQLNQPNYNLMYKKARKTLKKKE
jgi:hypothetical protein